MSNTDTTPHAQWQGPDLLLICHLQPGAKKSDFAGLHGDAIKIRIQAPPVDGKANAELIRFLAKAFGVSKRDVELVSGELNRHKRLKICSPAKIPEPLQDLLPES
ncbi:MAG: DUF167 family protein [Thalassolituus sp.]